MCHCPPDYTTTSSSSGQPYCRSCGQTQPISADSARKFTVQLKGRFASWTKPPRKVIKVSL